MATTIDDLSVTNYEPLIKDIASLQLEHQNLTQAENEQIKTNPALEANFKNLQAERYDRIERQKKYNDLLLSSSAQSAIESLPLKSQKWDAIAIVETDYELKNPSEDAIIYVQEEQALANAKQAGGNYYLTIKFAVQENRAQRQSQINGLKRYQKEKEAKEKAALELLLDKTAIARLERNEKYNKFVIDHVLKGASVVNAAFYQVPDRTWVAVYGVPQFIAPFLRSLPSFRPAGKAGYYCFTIWDLLELSKTMVLRNPHEFLNTILDSDPLFKTTNTLTDGRVLQLYEAFPHDKLKFMGNNNFSSSSITNTRHTDIGPGNTDLLIKALLDECFPFYADVKSGTKKYPHFIDYGENQPFPTPDQAFQGFKKLIGVGTQAYAEGIFRIMKKMGELNVSAQSLKNEVMVFPKTTDYSSRLSNFSAPRNPIIPKPNPDYDPVLAQKYGYNVTYNEGKIIYDEYYPKNERLAAQYIRGEITQAYYDAERFKTIPAFKAKNPSLDAKIAYNSSQKYNMSVFDKPEMEHYWVQIFQKGNEAFFEEMSNFEIEKYYSIRPQSSFLYVPKIGYINPFECIFIPSITVASPLATEKQRQAQLQREANRQRMLARWTSFSSALKSGNIFAASTALLNLIGFESAANMLGKIDRFTGGLLTSASMFGMTAIKVSQGAHISRQETLNALMVIAKVGIVVASGGSAAAIIGTVSSQLSQGTLGESAFGKAILQLGSILAVAGATGSTLEQALSQQAEKELKTQAMKQIAKETQLDKSVIGIVAVQTLVETSSSAAMGRDWESTLIEAAKKGSMQVAASLVPGGHLLVEAAFKVYEKGWDSMLPKGFDLDAIENPITAISNVDWKNVGKNIINSLKDKQNKQIIALIATGKMKPEDIARGVFVQKLSEDLAAKTALTEYKRNPNDPGVKAATEMLAAVHLEERRMAVADKIGRGKIPSKAEILLLEPAGQVYLDMIKEIIPEAQVGTAFSTAMKIGMPDISDYISMQGPDLRIDWPFKLPNLSLMDLKVDISKLSINGLSLLSFQAQGLSLPSFGKIPSPDQLTLFDLPKMGVDIDPIELERLVKITLPKNVNLRPRIPQFPGGELSPNAHIIDTDLNVNIRSKLAFSPYEHPMLKYGHVERKLTREQELYNMMRTLEVKQAMLKVEEGELAIAQMTSNTTIA